ncbi:hypothetical protein [Streptacidiphilus rugosus]|uniref:hypothetical protein n=1 Tax=Streptacidiphilus rugosus TaxID=405783 RepID=UPI000691C9CC|nr:hypothetical protein [Streptacidiphilus rugosus]
MSLDPLFLTAAAGIGLAAAPVLWTGARKRHDDRAERAFRTALRLLAGAAVLTLLLAAVATFRWADQTVGGSTLAGAGAAPPDRPPLLSFLLLLVPAALVLAFARRRRSEVRSRLDIPPHTDLESGSPLRLVGAHVVRVPGPRLPAGDRLLGEAVPAGGCERPDADRRVDPHPVG